MPWAELSRLSRRYDEACRSPLSNPRDREILRTKLNDLEDVAKTLRVKAAKAFEISEAEQERLQRNLNQMKKNRDALKATRARMAVVTEEATLKDVETLLAYTRFIIGLLDNREVNNEGIEP